MQLSQRAWKWLIAQIMLGSLASGVILGTALKASAGAPEASTSNSLANTGGSGDPILLGIAVVLLVLGGAGILCVYLLRRPKFKLDPIAARLDG